MKRIRISALLILGILLLAPGMSRAQSSSDIFGYFQSYYSFGKYNTTIPVVTPQGPAVIEADADENTFLLQQANLFFAHDFEKGFGAFVNFEFTNNYSSELNWGAFGIEEAWAKYEYNPSFRIRGGLLVPTFNELNAIKNRTPLLPYIMRPLVYEASIASLIDLDDYVPRRAFAQVDGVLAAGPASLNYALYVGNGEEEFAAENSETSVDEGGMLAIPGADTQASKLIGGRIGFATSHLRAGVSGTFDRASFEESLVPMPEEDAARTRIGFDATANYAGLTLSGEYIRVTHDVDVPTIPGLNLGKNKSFYYGTLQYDFDQLFVYATYSYIDDQMRPGMEGGLQATYLGGGYRATDNIVVKAQLQDMKLNENAPGAKVTGTNLYVGVTALF